MNTVINVSSTLVINNRTIKNRIAKGALSEGMATTYSGYVTQALLRLYETWAKGGLGLCITGNVMIDREAKNEPGNVVIENMADFVSLQKWAALGKRYDMAQIVQLSHPGKQCPIGLNKENVAPSAIGYDSHLSGLFPIPRALTEAEIFKIIARFGKSARICQLAGFDGVQLHGAHGYLISQFLSPIHNQRTDQWGGSLENRMRFVLACYQEVRKQTGDEFIVAIKLNSADFQKGGFGEDEALEVFKALDERGVDFIEISGGTYEMPALTGIGLPQKESTLKREAYFLEFAEKARQQVKTVLMVSGGFRTRQGMDAALKSGACDLIGVARPLIVETNAPQNILAGLDVAYARIPIKSGIKVLDRVAATEMLWYGHQMKIVGQGKVPNPALSPLWVMAVYGIQNTRKMLQGRIRVRA